MSTKRAHLNNPALLCWARSEVGLSCATVASKLRMPRHLYVQAEKGTHHLTFRQLERFAALVVRGVETLYLPDPPAVAANRGPVAKARAHCLKYRLPVSCVWWFAARFAEAAAEAAEKVKERP